MLLHKALVIALFHFILRWVSGLAKNETLSVYVSRMDL